MKYSKELKEQVVNLYKNSRLRISAIAMDVELSMDDVLNILEEYQRETGEKLSRKRYANVKKGNANLISTEKIKELAEKGYSNNQIADYFKQKGYPISCQAIWYKMVKIYGKDYFKDSEYKKRIVERKEKLLAEKRKREEEELKKEQALKKRIYELREYEKMSFQKIAKKLNEEGIKISIDTVKRKCEQIYADEQNELKDLRKEPKKTHDINEEELFNLREHGCTCDELGEYYEISPYVIAKLSGKIYREKGLRAPLSKRKLYIDLPQGELMELKKLGLSSEEISEFFKIKNIDVSPATIYRRLQDYSATTQNTIPRARADRTIDNTMKTKIQHLNKYDLKIIMYHIKNTRNATDEQIRELYEYYGIEMEDDKEIENCEEER